MLTSSTAFDVTKGEDAPEIGDTGPVTGIAHKDCSWKVPYKVRHGRHEAGNPSCQPLVFVLQQRDFDFY